MPLRFSSRVHAQPANPVASYLLRSLLPWISSVLLFNDSSPKSLIHRWSFTDKHDRLTGNDRYCDLFNEGKSRDSLVWLTFSNYSSIESGNGRNSRGGSKNCSSKFETSGGHADWPTDTRDLEPFIGCSWLVPRASLLLLETATAATSGLSSKATQDHRKSGRWTGPMLVALRSNDQAPSGDKCERLPSIRGGCLSISRNNAPLGSLVLKSKSLSPRPAFFPFLSRRSGKRNLWRWRFEICEIKGNAMTRQAMYYR